MTICFVVVQEWKPRWGYKRVNDMKDDWLIEVSDKAGDFNFCCCLVIESGGRELVKSHSVPPIENFTAFSLYTNKSKVEREG